MKSAVVEDCCVSLEQAGRRPSMSPRRPPRSSSSGLPGAHVIDVVAGQGQGKRAPF